MTKHEFLETMRLALNGKVDSGLVRENLQFYEDYINTEVRKGKAEEEVLAGLGDPRLLARTIVEAGGGQASGAAENGSWRWQEEEEYQTYERPEERRFQMLARVPAWAWLVIMLVVIVLVLGAVFSVLAALLPILLPILLVLFAVKLFRDWIN